MAHCSLRGGLLGIYACVQKGFKRLCYHTRKAPPKRGLSVFIYCLLLYRRRLSCGTVTVALELEELPLPSTLVAVMV